ncbi:nucleoside phosphorylase domain-containing protein [Dactylonectria macrodidyma]|uniref:Nucleoside phosphorylase domain-containing protein n=1 Tax=Dactylonectria macrodidyma TaxID=307937 RepID=A0A9P9EWC2_9HYPO|nr:nucleoside phosphorylase domain-containing protein [Dactylonectria macrodidyma]
MSDPNKYTVGWVCAITTESVAAQLFLDEKHDGPEYVATGDNNDYTLGKVGKHNVVIAVIPDAEYGVSSATAVAKDLQHSFLNVRVVLMVGIAGGAPSPKNDIRLGDIVVSSPRNGKPGVLQYDFGKAIQGQEFKQTGCLSLPPSVLRTAVSGLRAQYEVNCGHQLEEAIDGVLKKKSRLQKKYTRPHQSTDRLCDSEITHPLASEDSCVAVCGDDSSTLMPRHQRAENEDALAIHFGLNASGDKLMKDAVVRVKFAKENDVLCFEMEAAGLMNQCPCLVIRGICDYSDTHKTKEWQGYAATAAAAYAKDILYRIHPKKIEEVKELSEALSG